MQNVVFECEKSPSTNQDGSPLLSLFLQVSKWKSECYLKTEKLSF